MKMFKSGDRVYHKSLELNGTFVEYDWTGKDECHVNFDTEDGYEDCRHVTTNQLEFVSETAIELTAGGVIDG